MRLIIYAILLFQLSCSVSKDPRRKEVRLLEKGKLTENSSYVYWLPYENGRSHLVVQGYFTRLSHKNKIAVDIKMKKGTKVLAARDGVVVRLKEDGDKGSLNRKHVNDGNYIVIQHTDNS